MQDFLTQYGTYFSSTNGIALTSELLSLIASNLSDMQHMSKAESDARANGLKDLIFKYKEALREQDN